MPLASAQTFAQRYRSVRRLGSGGMATVFLAEDERLGRLVAIKRLHGESSEEVARRFRREARLGASLNHPGVVAIYDIASDDEGVLIVMEYVEGRTLREEIAAGALPPERALPILRAVADALDHAHRQGVIHRDVKPANVLVRPDGTAKLADLGIATAAEQSRITRSGAVLGTAAYIAPERLDGRPGGAGVDVYSLAAVAFEALSGRKALQGATPMEVARRAVSQPPPDVRAAMPDAPERLADALRRGLAKDPADRQESAGALIDEIEAALAGAPRPRAEDRVRAASPPNGRRSRPRAMPGPPGGARARGTRPPRPAWLPIAAAAACAALVAIGLAALLGGGSGDKPPPKRASAHGAKRHAAPAKRRAATPVPAAPAQPGGRGQGGAATSDPAAAVDDFYTRAANGDYGGAWRLATPAARAQLGGYGSFAASQSSLESISFPELKVVRRAGNAATVELRSQAVHTDRVDRCVGTIDLVASGGTWKLDALHIAGCKRNSRK